MKLLVSLLWIPHQPASGVDDGHSVPTLEGCKRQQVREGRQGGQWENK
jgi:hypothetical protein